MFGETNIGCAGVPVKVSVVEMAGNGFKASDEVAEGWDVFQGKI
ncbi:MAG TPA: hypothetical protein VFT06_08880 [Flavisolibacter sp.]|nr:hypothetical protein [Flavisolibacter sp.]